MDGSRDETLSILKRFAEMDADMQDPPALLPEILFGGAVQHRILVGDRDGIRGIDHAGRHHCPTPVLRRSGRRLGIHHVCDRLHRRESAVLHRHHGAVPRKDV